MKKNYKTESELLIAIYNQETVLNKAEAELTNCEAFEELEFEAEVRYQAKVLIDLRMELFRMNTPKI